MVDLKKNVDELCGIAKQLDNQELYQVSLFLRQRINQPDSYVVFVGESCSGKSTIINSLIRKDILPVSSVPSTGTITEVFVDENTDHDSYAVINRNATMELLDYPTFCELACRPDPNVQRLRAVLPSSGLGIAGARLFDTPGYGSLIEAHDEVLMDFLPNCDSVVYIVGYKVGIQKEDHEFLGRLEELTRLGIPIYLVINRCPAGVTDSDRRVAEIYRTATSLLTNQEIPLFLIPSAPTHQELFIAPALSDLKAKIVQDLNSQDRRQDLYAAFLAYLNELAALLRSELERRIRNLEMDAAEAASLRDKMEKLGAEFQHAIDSIVRPGFHKIKTNLPKCVANRRDTMEKKICDEISRQHVASKDEMIVYTTEHLLPFYAREEAKNIQHYLSVELEAIDEEVNDYLNTAVIKFEQDIQLQFSNFAVKAGEGVVKDVAGKLFNSGLLQYFAKFGGRGGAGAGVANAASHALKVLGDLFGHTFKRETHIALKQAISKIGLTSTKAIGAAASVIIELVVMVFEYGTWKPMLISKTKKGLGKWKDDTIELIQKDLDKLEEENINTISSIAKTYADAFAVDEHPVGNIDELRTLLNSLEKVEEEIAV